MSQPSFDLDLDPTPTFRVSELAGAIGAAVRKGFPEEVWVRGEIDSLSRSAAGHIYFDLVEGVGNERVALRVALFRTVAEAVERHLAKHHMRLENGLEVRIMGRVELYEARGQVNLRMSGIDPTYTLGRLAQDRDRLVRLLTGEGLLERNRRLVLAPVPLRIGIVTSRESAAYADFVHELEASGFAWRVMVADSRVQGIEATGSVVRALVALAGARSTPSWSSAVGAAATSLQCSTPSRSHVRSPRCRCRCSLASGTRSIDRSRISSLTRR